MYYLKTNKDYITASEQHVYQMFVQSQSASLGGKRMKGFTAAAYTQRFEA